MDEIHEYPQLEMGEHFHARHAHKYIAAYLFIVVLLVAMGAVYTWQHTQVERATTQITALEAQRGQLDQQLSAITAAPPQNPGKVSPTASWKTYCDATYGGCFQYPDNWKLATTTNTDTEKNIYNGKPLVTTSLMNPAQSVEVRYVKPFVPSASGTFHVDNLVGLAAGNLALKITGGYFTDVPPYKPFYAVVDATAPISQVGKTIPKVYASQYTAKNQQTAYFAASPTNGGFKTTAQADAWFSSTDAQTALAVLQSLYYK